MGDALRAGLYRLLPTHLGNHLGRGLVFDAEEHAAGGVRQELCPLLTIGGMNLRDILPNQHGRAVGAQEGDCIHEGIEPPERARLIEEQHDLVAGPLRAFLAHDGVERAARHHAKPAPIGEELFLIDAKVKRDDFGRVQIFQREGAAC